MLYEPIINALLELKQAMDTAKIQGDDETIIAVMHKYDIFFYRLESISSKDFRLSLRDYFHIDITYEELLKILPSICNSLGFQTEKLVKPSNGYRTDSDFDYFITLK